MKTFNLFLGCLSLNLTLFGQVKITFNNPSFEGIPGFAKLPEGW